VIYLSSELRGAIDPEHLPPVNPWERFGKRLRYVSRIPASKESVSRFRAAAASFSVAILAFLQQTQDFFNRQRLIWILVLIAFGMSLTSGAGLFKFCRAYLNHYCFISAKLDSQVRKLLGRGLFILASLYSCMHTTIEVWIDGSQIGAQSSPNLLAETRRKLSSEQMTLITAMRSFSQSTLYEPLIGGKFPKSIYENIISEI